MSVAIRLLLTCTLLLASPAVAQTNEAPLVNGCSPHSGSVNSVIELKGFRLGLDEFESAKAFFIQNGIEIPARTGGGSSVTNDRLNGPQTLEVIVPESVVRTTDGGERVVPIPIRILRR